MSESKVLRSGKYIIDSSYIFIRIFGEIMELDEFTLYVPSKIIPSDMIHSLPTFWLNMTQYRNTPVAETASANNYPPKISHAIIFIFL